MIKLICLLITFFIFGFVIGSVSDYVGKLGNKSSLAEYLVLRSRRNTIAVPWYIYDDLYTINNSHTIIPADHKLIKYYPNGFDEGSYTIIPDRYKDYKNDIKLRDKERADKVLAGIKKDIGWKE